MKLKFRGILLTSILAIAGIFGVSSVLINKQIEEAPVAEKAEAASYPEQWYITGNINGKTWGDWQSFTTSDGENYSFIFTATTSTDFKISSTQSYSGFVINRGMTGDYLDYNNKGWLTYTDWESGDNFKIKYDGEYVISYNTEITSWDKPSWGFSIAPVTHSIYYVSESGSETTDRIYAWMGSGDGALKEFGNWPGSLITSVGTDVTGVFNFEGTYKKIYRIPTHSTKFKFVNYDGSVSSSSDLVIEDGAAYWWNGPANSDAGSAISLIVDLESARNKVAASGSIQDYSICGIDSGTRTTLLSRYNGLTSSAKTFVDSSYTYTYVGEGSAEGNVYFSDIFAQLSKMSGTRGLPVINVFSSLFNDSNNTSTIIVIVASSVALLSVTALSILVIKKRKQKEE